jgi:hypothetical protein
MKRLFSYLLPLVALAISVLSAGCDALAVTDAGYVKGQARKYSRLILEKDFSQAATMQHPQMIWQRVGKDKLQGEAASQGFLGSIKAISNMDTFYFYVHDIEKVDDKRLVMDVTMQAHIVVNSMAMVYDNIVWRAKLLWVKTDKATWKLGAIQETTTRENGSPPQDVKPL